jgi:hypothetical protein
VAALPTNWIDPERRRSIFTGPPVTVARTTRTVTGGRPPIEALIDCLPDSRAAR